MALIRSRVDRTTNVVCSVSVKDSKREGSGSMSVLVAARLAIHMRVSSGKKSSCARALRSVVPVLCRAHDDTNDLSAKSETTSDVFEVCAALGVVPEPSRLDAYNKISFDQPFTFLDVGCGNG